MAHELDMSNGRANMAYIGETPWHGLGQALTEGASIETWGKEAGMEYTILESPVQFTETTGGVHVFDSKKVLYRNDTMAPLGVVGSRYHVLQPEQVLEFFRDLTEERGFILETAGVLFNGSKYWAMARTPHSLMIQDDQVKEHLLLATACDGSLATTARYVRTRVVCNNTIQAALGEKSGRIIRVEHRSQFDSKNVKKELKLLNEEWDQFADQTQRLADRRVSYEEAANYYISLFGKPQLPMDEQTSKIPEELYMNFVSSDYIGSQLEAAKGTAWGMLNVITENIDHVRGEMQDRRLKSAWLGKGAELKMRAYGEAIKLI